MPTEKEIRDELLKVPDHVALKSCAQECKRLEKRIEQQSALIKSTQELLDEERLRRLSLLSVLKQMHKASTYEMLKKEANKEYENNKRNTERNTR